MCPVKYAGWCRTISWAAERAHSLASGTITSWDLGLSSLSLSKPSLSHFSLPLCHFFLADLFSSSYSQRQSDAVSPWQIFTSCVHLCCGLFVVFKYLCIVWDFNLYLNLRVCVCPSAGMWCVWRRGPNGAAELWVEQCNDFCLLALQHLYVHWCLQTRHVCLPFLNEAPHPQRECSRLSSAAQQTEEERRGKVLLL